jgi:cytochrome oxidase Cu insertion factor (SCO1/SenC/PrrC family)
VAVARERLPVIGPAPPFALTAQDGRRVALPDLRGKVVAVTFMYPPISRRKISF